MTALDGGSLAVLTLSLGMTVGFTVLLGVWGARGQLTPNAAVGIRTKRTLSSDHAWYHVHRQAAPWLMASGAVLLAGTVPPFFLPTGTAQFTAIMAACVGYVLILCIGVVKAHRTIPTSG